MSTSPLSPETLSGFKVCRSYVCCYGIWSSHVHLSSCIWKTQFPCGPPPPLVSTVSRSPLLNRTQSQGWRGLVKTFHWRLSAPKSLTLFTLPICEYLLIPIWLEESFANDSWVRHWSRSQHTVANGGRGGDEGRAGGVPWRKSFWWWEADTKEWRWTRGERDVLKDNTNRTHANMDQVKIRRPQLCSEN